MGRIERLARELERKARRLTLPERIEQRFGRYRDDPVAFCREVLGVESAVRRSTGGPYQFEVLQSLVEHPRVAMRSGHGGGKTSLCAWALLWWLLTRPFSRVVVVAPEYSRQIRAVLFGEVRKWARRSKVKLPVTCLASRVLVGEHGEAWSATGMSAAGDPARLEGFHAEGGVLLIVDECKGISQQVFDSLQGALSGGEDSRLLVASVPGGTAGPFWKACNDPTWKIYHVPSTDSSLVSPRWVEDRARDWGRGSPLYQTRVLGEFATSGEGMLFPLQLIEAAMSRTFEPPPDAPAALGVDVARSTMGDLNVVAACRNGQLEVVKAWHSADLMRTTTEVLHVVTELGIERIAIDIGGPGGGVADRLKELGYNQVIPVAFGGGAVDDGQAQVRASQRFRNRRAQILWALREALERGEVALADDDEIRADLSALRYEFSPSGLIQIEPKDEVRRRLGRSPDRADALALAWVASAARIRPPLIIRGPGFDGDPAEIEQIARENLVWMP